MKKFLGIVAIVAICGTLAFAGQVNNKTYTVPVTVTVAAEVSMWSDGAIALTLNGKNAENSDAVASTITHINNVDATISVQVTGTAYPSVNFFIFGQGTAGDATAAMKANAGAPAGALPCTIGGGVVVVKHVLKSLSAVSLPVVYAADAPNALPEVGATNDLVVTWTIAAP